VDFVPLAPGLVAGDLQEMAKIVKGSFSREGLHTRGPHVELVTRRMLAAVQATTLFWTAEGAASIGCPPVPWEESYGTRLKARWERLAMDGVNICNPAIQSCNSLSFVHLRGPALQRKLNRLLALVQGMTARAESIRLADPKVFRRAGIVRKKSIAGGPTPDSRAAQGRTRYGAGGLDPNCDCEDFLRDLATTGQPSLGYGQKLFLALWRAGSFPNVIPLPAEHFVRPNGRGSLLGICQLSGEPPGKFANNKAMEALRVEMALAVVRSEWGEHGRKVPFPICLDPGTAIATQLCEWSKSGFRECVRKPC
jgi:hypothetical protein